MIQLFNSPPQHKYFANLPVVVITVFYLFVTSCQSGVKNEADNVDETVSAISDENKTDIKLARNFFYNIFLPCEMIYLFEETNAPFEPKLLNSLQNAPNYATNSKKALNLGVYGVDLGYLRIYKDNSQLNEYSKIITNLSQELGIPDEHVQNAMEYLKDNMNSNDSVYKVTCELYDITDSYLNQNDRQTISALVILGGWVESVYIICRMMDDTVSMDLMQRIGSQKYSLRSLISFLTQFQDDPLITNYLVMLKAMWVVYDDVDIYLESPQDIQIDTVNRKISVDYEKVKISQDHYARIREIVFKIRNHMVR